MSPERKDGEIRQLARYQVRPEGLTKCLAAIQEFVAHVRAQEPGTSAEVKKFASVLYPECLAPVEFTDYQLVDAKGAP